MTINWNTIWMNLFGRTELFGINMGVLGSDNRDGTYCDPDEYGLLDTEKISFIRRQFIAIEPPGELLPDPQGHAL